MPIAFNMKAIKDFEEETGVKLMELLQMAGSGGFDDRLLILIWFAFVQGYLLRDKKKPEFEREALENMDVDILIMLINVFTSSIENMDDSDPAKKHLAAEANKKTASLKD